ncbi:MAG TPA: Rieske 2Fe-2S domain-containing protein, partial [Verrucomicrobiota bacterium]|nr:Rieske 2Fe-2S domain-containing protein [Verrucomicrobiota bacterium]
CRSGPICACPASTAAGRPADPLDNLLGTPDRRRFLRTLLVSSAAVAFGAETRRGTVLAAVNPASGNSILRVPLASFPALQATAGFASVRLGLAGTQTILKPIFVNRENGVFSVFTSECTHEGATVALFSQNRRRATGPLHGSVFSSTGARISGQATRPLPRYDHELSGDTLLIEIPELPAYEVTVGAFSEGQLLRVALSFNALRNFDYQVQVRSAADGAWSVRPHATTPAGALTATPFRAPGGPATLYVDRSAEAEFFAVSVAARTV